jgi:hypothetical protein
MKYHFESCLICDRLPPFEGMLGHLGYPFCEECEQRYGLVDVSEKVWEKRATPWPFVLWFSVSPDIGDPLCLCSNCYHPIEGPHAPLRLFMEVPAEVQGVHPGKPPVIESRFCGDPMCMSVVVGG